MDLTLRSLLFLQQKVEEDDDSSLESQGAKQACPSRACAPRADKLEAMMEKRVAAQTARQKAQSRLVRCFTPKCVGRLE